MMFERARMHLGDNSDEILAHYDDNQEFFLRNDRKALNALLEISILQFISEGLGRKGLAIKMSFGPN
jgi:hypothetical protein